MSLYNFLFLIIFIAATACSHSPSNSSDKHSNIKDGSPVHLIHFGSDDKNVGYVEPFLPEQLGAMTLGIQNQRDVVINYKTKTIPIPEHLHIHKMLTKARSIAGDNSTGELYTYRDSKVGSLQLGWRKKAIKFPFDSVEFTADYHNQDQAYYTVDVIRYYCNGGYFKPFCPKGEPKSRQVFHLTTTDLMSAEEALHNKLEKHAK